MTLGQKIKACRTALRLTQDALAGDDITRNMLSQIEHDTALPSLSTLKALAKRLRVPLGYLLSEEDNLLAYQKMEIMPRLYALQKEGKYDACLRMADTHFGANNDDEIAFLRCEASCYLAEQELQAGSMKLAVTHAREVKLLAEQTVYQTKHLLAVASMVEAVATNPNAPRLEFDTDAYLALSAHTMRSDLFHYLSDDLHYDYDTPAMKQHMTAKKLMQAEKYEQAYQMLDDISSAKSDESIGAYILWRIYGDMETCAKFRHDFENAYRMSSKRMSLLTAFTS